MINLKTEAEKYLIDIDNSKSGLWTEDDRDIIDAFVNFVEKTKYVEEKILQGQLNILNSLDSKLQSKVETLNEMASDFDQADDKKTFLLKISGIRLSKEEIRREIKGIAEKLEEL